MTEPNHFRLGFIPTLHYYNAMLKKSEAEGPLKVIEVRRRLGGTDLFFLLTNILKRRDMLREWLFLRCREFQRDPDDWLDLWAREHYKAVDVDEPVPTPSGWTTHGALTVGDWVYGADGIPTRVVGKTEVFTKADCYRVTFDDGYSVVVSGDHLWEVQKRTRKRQHRRAGQDREVVVMKTSDMADHNHATDNRLAVTISPSINMPDAILPVMPYTLGLWLGDGTAAEGRITCGDQECFERVRQDGYEIGEPPPSCAIVRTIYGLSPILRGLGLLKNKHIPIFFKRSSTAQRLELLRGLMDSDGHCNTRGTATFVNKSEILARDVFELCASLGMKPRWRAHKHGVYHVSFQAYEGQCPFFLPRKAARCRKGDRDARRFVLSVEPVENRPVSCIQVAAEDGLYMIGRQYCLTHNSTIITFGGNIFEVIKDPEITIGIFSHTKAIARAFLKQIKTEMETNPDLPLLWPEIFYTEPAKQSKRWSIDDGIVVKRTTNQKEATVEGHGLVDGMPTSKHFKLLDYDDVVTKEGVNTPEQIAKTTEAFQMSDNLGSEGGRKRYVGTRYHLFDTYSEMIDQGIASPRIHAATDDGTEYGSPVLLSAETLAKKRIAQGPYVFASQMLLDPIADKAMGFQLPWLVKADTDYNAAMASLWRFIIVDPASRKDQQRSGAMATKKLKNDFTTMWVIGVGADGLYRVLDIVRDRLSLTGRTDEIIRLHRYWKPELVAWEEYGKDADIEHINFVQKQQLYEFDIHPLGGGMRKELRILRLVPKFENGFKSISDGGDGIPKSRIILPTSCIKKDYQGHARDLVKDFIEEEYVAFPVLKHDDMLDGLARIDDLEAAGLIGEPSAVPPPMRSTRIEEGLRKLGDKGGHSWVTA